MNNTDLININTIEMDTNKPIKKKTKSKTKPPVLLVIEDEDDEACA